MKHHAKQDREGCWGVEDENGYRVCDLEEGKPTEFIARLVANVCDEVDRLATTRSTLETG